MAGHAAGHTMSMAQGARHKMARAVTVAVEAEQGILWQDNGHGSRGLGHYWAAGRTGGNISDMAQGSHQHAGLLRECMVSIPYSREHGRHGAWR
jgi:hypothetical protein